MDHSNRNEKTTDFAFNTDEGIGWILYPTLNFDKTLGFFRDQMGMHIADEGVAVSDYHFNRYAQINMPDETVIEIVEPKSEFKDQFTHPIISITDDQLEERVNHMLAEGIVFISDVIHANDGWGWIYFKTHEEIVFQLQGPYTPPE